MFQDAKKNLGPTYCITWVKLAYLSFKIFLNFGALSNFFTLQSILGDLGKHQRCMHSLFLYTYLICSKYRHQNHCCSHWQWQKAKLNGQAE